jgi:putative tryptophan/tyrosine transport system substrate-binding protein
MRRRTFLAALGGTAAWPIDLTAQEQPRARRVGALQDAAESDPSTRAWLEAFRSELDRLGWREGLNLAIDERWAAGDGDRRMRFASELVGLRPDILFGEGTPVVAALQRAARTTPIVFVGASDPVRSGFVQSLAKPGGNITGFVSFEPAFGGKWLETLKELAPSVTRVALLYNPETHTGQYFTNAEAAASRLGVTLTRLPFRAPSEIERDVGSFARQPNGGLLVLADTSANTHRRTIVKLAALHRLPAVYAHRHFTIIGGLVSYGPDRPDQYRRAAAYVDRILRGIDPGELPVQSPAKFEFIVNVGTARALGLSLSPALLARADEVLE